MEVLEDVSPPTKKRRIPKACAACRKSKVRCDEKRPCSRCVQAAVTCTWHERLKDPLELRVQGVEEAIAAMGRRLDERFRGTSHAIQGDGSIVSHVSPRDGGYVNTAVGPTVPQTMSVHSGENGSASVGCSATSHATQASPQSISSLDLVVPHTVPTIPLMQFGDATAVSMPAAHSQSGASFAIRQPASGDIVSCDHVTAADSQAWFRVFFEGCDRFIPIFDPIYDTYNSVRRRSHVLFDIMIIYGCRAEVGSLSKAYQTLYSTIRQHTSDLILQEADHSIETIQALLILASYSDSGAVLCDIALRAALQVDLPGKVTELFSSLVAERGLRCQGKRHDLMLYVSARTWYGLYVLDQILSLDGGKPASVSLQAASRRVRALVKHPYRTALDLRLFAQVELNELRAASYSAATTAARADDQALTTAIDGGLLDLNIWHSEWQTLIDTYVHASEEHAITALNLRIQHAWAVLALHLKALAVSGIDNIALMTDSQRGVAFAAKEAAEQHLELLLTSTASLPDQSMVSNGVPYRKPYVANFRYAMEFVWAKNTFCVLIVLRLAILLGDTVPAIQRRLEQAREFLAELNKVGMGANLSYTRILAQTVDKCERAVAASVQAEDTARQREDSSDGDFQTFIPPQFMFEWDFPGLHLCYIPIDWQDLFLDFTASA